MKINEKEIGDGPFKKTISFFSLSLSLSLSISLYLYLYLYLSLLVNISASRFLII